MLAKFDQTLEQLKRDISDARSTTAIPTKTVQGKLRVARVPFRQLTQDVSNRQHLITYKQLANDHGTKS